MTASIWETHGMYEKIENILDVQPHDAGHHFGRPFLTPYQIAIVFKQEYPETFAAIGKPLGGEGTNQRDSLAQYIAHQLSKRIKDRQLPNIEGRFLSRLCKPELSYQDDARTVTSSNKQSWDLSMFRLLTDRG